MTRAAFSRRMEQLGQLVTDAVAYFSAWDPLYYADPDAVAVFNRYSGHFTPARVGLQLVMTLGIAKLFDQNWRAISIPNVISTAERNLSTFVPLLEDATLTEMKQRMRAQALVLRRLTRLRNKRLAHYDVVINGRIDITYEELSHLVEDIKWIWNELDHGHRQNVTAFQRLEDDARRHTAALIDALRAAPGR